MTRRRMIAAALAVATLIGVLSFSLFQALKFRSDLTHGICAHAVSDSIQVSVSLNEALQTNDRRTVQIAGQELTRLDGILRFDLFYNMGFQPVHGPGSLGYLADLIVFGDESAGITLGSPTDKTPFSEEEITLIEQISTALEDFALSFYPEGTTIDTFPNTEADKLDIPHLNQALKNLQAATEPLFIS